jgi:hypothetical protein
MSLLHSLQNGSGNLTVSYPNVIYSEAARFTADFLLQQMGQDEEYVDLYFHTKHVFKCFV